MSDGSTLSTRRLNNRSNNGLAPLERIKNNSNDVQRLNKLLLLRITFIHFEIFLVTVFSCKILLFLANFETIKKKLN